MTVTSLYRSPTQDAARLYTQAIKLATEGNDALAARLLREAYSLDATNVLALIELGNAHYRMGDVATATGLYRDATIANPGIPDAHFNLGFCRYQAGDYGRAVLSFRRALAIDDTMTVAWFQLAMAYERCERRRQARAAYERYLGLVGADDRWRDVATANVDRLGADASDWSKVAQLWGDIK